MIADSSIPVHLPTKVRSMREIYPYINTLYGDNHLIEKRESSSLESQYKH